MSDRLSETQALIVTSLMGDIQKGGELIGALSEGVGLPWQAFPNEHYGSFYRAAASAWAKMAGNGGNLQPQDILSELERQGKTPEYVQKWSALMAQPHATSSLDVVSDAARYLSDTHILQRARQELTAWKANPETARSSLVELTGKLMGLAAGGGEESRPSQIVKDADSRGYVPPVSTGWAKLDEVMGGAAGAEYGGFHYYEGDMWIVGAPSGHGKSAFGCNIAVNLAKQGAATLYVTWEMSKIELIRRMVCNLGDVSYGVAFDPSKGTPEEQRRRVDAVRMLDAMVRIYERPQTAQEIQAVVRRHKIEYGEGLVVVIVDHLGLAQSSKKEGWWRTLEEFTYSMHRVAREERVCFVCFSQVPAEVEAELRESNKATSTDFRGSRGVRMAADYAFFLCKHSGLDTSGHPIIGHKPQTVIQMVKDRRFGQESWFTLPYTADRYRIG